MCIYRHYFRLKIAQKHDSHMRLYAIGNLSLGHMVWASIDVNVLSVCVCVRAITRSFDARMWNDLAEIPFSMCLLGHPQHRRVLAASQRATNLRKSHTSKQ